MTIPEILCQPKEVGRSSELYRSLMSLADFWLNSECRREAWQKDRPSQPLPPRSSLPTNPGCCYPLIALDEKEASRVLQYLKPGIVLPLQWQTGKIAHDRRLPRSLQDVADKALSAVSPDVPGLSLHFPVDGHWPDLSWMNQAGVMNASFGSAFAALCVGLISAEQNLKPDPTVLCSAAWKNGSLVKINWLAQKLQLAMNYIGTGGHVFVVPEQKEDAWDEADKVGMSKERIGVFRNEGNMNVRQQLAPMLAEASSPPEKDSLLDDRLRYYEALVEHNRRKADTYFATHISADVAETCRKQLTKATLLETPITHLITVATDNPEAVHIMIKALRPDRVLILHTVDMKENAIKIRNECVARQAAGGRIEAKLLLLPYVPVTEGFLEVLGTDMDRLIQPCLQGVELKSVAFDIDRGLTLQKIALLKYVIKPGNLVVTISHTWKRLRTTSYIDHRESRAVAWRHS